MVVDSVPVLCVYLAVTCNITKQTNLHILHHIAASHRDGVLAGNMILLHHLHGVGAGGNVCDGVGGAVALYDGFIGRLGIALEDQLNSHIVGVAVKTRCRAGNGVSNNRDVLPNCGYGSVSSNGNLVANCLFAAANAPSLELLAGRSSKAVCRERVFAETPVTSVIVPVPPLASKETV